MFGTASRDTIGMPRNHMPDHDNSYKLLFSHQEMVRDLLVGFVQEPWLAEIDFSTLEKVNGSYVTDDLPAAKTMSSGACGSKTAGSISTSCSSSSPASTPTWRCAS